MSEVQKTEIFYKDNQGYILLSKNKQVGMRKKNIDILIHFMREMTEEKDMDIKYIRSK